MEDASRLRTRVSDYKWYVRKTGPLLEEWVKREGWREAFAKLRREMDLRFGNGWYARNKILLGIIDCEELLGFDGDVEKVLARIEDLRDFDAVKSTAARRLIGRVRRQLRSGGSTLFFDLDRMKAKASSVLTEDLVAARNRETGDTSMILGRPISERLQGLTHAVFLWNGDDPDTWPSEDIWPSEEEDNWIEQIQEKAGGELEILFESGYLDPLAVAELATKSRQHDLWWRGPQYIWPYLLYWPVKALLSRDSPEACRVVSAALKRSEPFEAAALAELLFERWHPRYLGTLVELARREMSRGTLTDDKGRLSITPIIEGIERHGIALPDAERAMIADAMLKKRGYRGVDASPVQEAMDEMTRQRIAVRVLPKNEAISLARKALLGSASLRYAGLGTTTADYIDIQMDVFLSKESVDVVPMLIEFAVPKDFPWVRFGAIEYLLRRHPQSVPALRELLLKRPLCTYPGSREDRMYFIDGDRTRNHREQDEEAVSRDIRMLAEIMGEIGPFIIIGDMYLEAEGKPSRIKNQYDTKAALMIIDEMSAESRDATILTALRGEEPRALVGAYIYIELRGIKDKRIMDELRSALDKRHKDEIYDSVLLLSRELNQKDGRSTTRTRTTE